MGTIEGDVKTCFYGNVFFIYTFLLTALNKAFYKRLS